MNYRRINIEIFCIHYLCNFVFVRTNTKNTEIKTQLNIKIQRNTQVNRYIRKLRNTNIKSQIQQQITTNTKNQIHKQHHIPPCGPQQGSMPQCVLAPV